MVTTTGKGGFTGKLYLEGQSLSFSGNKIDRLSGQAPEITIARKNKAPVKLDLKLDTSANGSIKGTVQTDGAPIPFKAKPGLFTKKNPHPFNGRTYTVVLPDADALFGNGYLTISFTPDGTATVGGKLADATPVLASVQTVEADDQTNWLVPLYDVFDKVSSGVLKGELLLPKTPVSGGSEVKEGAAGLGWLKLADAKNKLFPAGFLKQLNAVGARWLALSKNVSLFSGDSSTANFQVLLDPLAEALPLPISQPATWPATNVPKLTAPVTNGLAINFQPTTGIFSGSFSRTPKTANKAVKTNFEGVVLSHPLPLEEGGTPVRGAGFFTTETESAAFELQ